MKVQRNNIDETDNNVLSILDNLLKKKPDIKEEIDRIIITVLKKVLKKLSSFKKIRLLSKTNKNGIK